MSEKPHRASYGQGIPWAYCGIRRLHLLIGLSGFLIAATTSAAVMQPVLPPVTRAEVVVSLLSSQTIPLPTVRNTGRFKDLPVGTWYEREMLAAETLQIISADSKGRLRPESPVTRAELLKMLSMVFGLPQRLPHNYVDVPKDVWFAPYAGIAQEYELFPDSVRSTLKPGRPLTRQEFGRILQRAIVERMKIQMAADEQRIATEQSAQKLQLYLTISTRRLRVPLIQSDVPLPTVEPPKLQIVKPSAAPSPSLTALRSEVLALVNAERRKRSLPPLRQHFYLENSAQAYAERLSKEGFFSHIDPSGGTLRDRIEAGGYYDRSYDKGCACVKGYTLGENLARGQKTPEEAVADWMKSTSHREAILTPEYTDTGIGLSAGVWVQHFGGVLLPE